MMNFERQIVFNHNGERVIVDIDDEMMSYGFFYASLTNGMTMIFDSINDYTIKVYSDGDVVYKTPIEVYPECCCVCMSGISTGLVDDEQNIFCSKECVEIQHDKPIKLKSINFDFDEEKDYYITFNNLTTKIEL